MANALQVDSKHHLHVGAFHLRNATTEWNFFRNWDVKELAKVWIPQIHGSIATCRLKRTSAD